jgi:hypothetical protein
MLGVPAASAATTAALFFAGIIAVAFASYLARRRLRALETVERVIVACLALSLVALPWVGWRFVEDLRVTTKLDPYERANMGPIQAYMPGYLVQHVHIRGTWTTDVGPTPNEIARSAFPSLVLVKLFPQLSAPPGRADWIIRWGYDAKQPFHVAVRRR